VSSNVVWHESSSEREQRWAQLGIGGAVVWFTGLSGSGKSTVAVEVERALVARRRPAALLVGDNLRHGLNADLGFSPGERQENCRRVAEVARLFADAGLVCLVPIISPYAIDRRRARQRHEDDGLRFLEIFVDTPLTTCVERDPKGLYRRALDGELTEFTGVSAPYEAPEHPDVHLRTDGVDLEALADRVIAAIAPSANATHGESQIWS